jgi:pimeloyl-ACP methyl ester carboxylesterase
MNTFNHKDGNTLTISSAEIYYEETGSAYKPVLLFLHGGFGNIEDFNTLLTKIEKDFRIVGIDSRGQGKSTLGQEKLTYELIANDVEQILKHLAINELSIIGFSDGGIIGYRLAAYSNFKINKLITIGSRWHKSNVFETQEILSAVDPQKWRKKFPEMVAGYEKINPQPDFDILTSEVVDMWLNTNSYPNEDVKNIIAETLIIRGDKDHLVKRNFVFDIAGLIENSHLSNIPFAGHAVYIEQPEIMNLIINKFLNQ